MAVKENTLNLQVGKEEAKILLDFYVRQIGEAYEKISIEKNKIDELSMKAASLQRLINSQVFIIDSDNTSQGQLEALEQYQKTWPLYKKCLYALRTTKKTMTTRELANFLINVEGHDVGGFDFLQKDIGATLYQKMPKSSPRLVTRYKVPGSNEFSYGLPKWFNSDGSLKDPYKS
jgi:hypothetical protein